MSDLITYDDKIRLKSQNVSEKYKVTAGDMNEIKSVVNTNVELVDEINKPENWVSVGTTAPTDGRRVWFEKGKNLFNIDSTYHGTINAQGGEGSNESFRTTQFIPTTPGTTYYFSSTQISGQTNKQIYIAYYNGSKTFVSRTSYKLLESAFTTPTNCYYMRAGVGSAWQENIMLELGSQKTSYEPYIDEGIYVDNELFFSKSLIKSINFGSITTSATGYYDLGLMCNEVAIIGIKHNAIESGTKIETYSNQLGHLFIRCSVNGEYSARTINNLVVYCI